jgi:hypothetical protein
MEATQAVCLNFEDGGLSICKALHVESGMRSPDEAGVCLMEAKQRGARNAFGLGLSRSGDKSFARPGAVHVQAVSKNRTNTPQQKGFSVLWHAIVSIQLRYFSHVLYCPKSSVYESQNVTCLMVQYSPQEHMAGCVVVGLLSRCMKMVPKCTTTEGCQRGVLVGDN